MRDETARPRLFIDRLTRDDIARLLEIEQACYPDPWSQDLFLSEVSHRAYNCPMAGLPPNWDPAEPPHTGIGRRLDQLPPQRPIIGFVIAHLLSVESHILNIAVDPAHQGKGFGRVLLYAILNYAAERGGSRAVLEVRESNLRAQELYRSVGFEIVGHRKNYYERQREDALVMTLGPLFPIYPRPYRMAASLRCA